jgi:F0F1-type ATP synthase assembly protein I
VERKKNEGAKDWTRALREAGPYLGLGTSLAASVLAGLAVGYWADTRWDTSPLLFLLGGVLGMGAAVIQFWKTVGPKS